MRRSYFFFRERRGAGGVFGTVKPSRKRAGAMPTAPANRMSIVIEGSLAPRSTSWTYCAVVRAASATCSWVSSISARTARKLVPTTLPAMERLLSTPSQLQILLLIAPRSKHVLDGWWLVSYRLRRDE